MTYLPTIFLLYVFTITLSSDEIAQLNIITPTGKQTHLVYPNYGAVVIPSPPILPQVATWLHIHVAPLMYQPLIGNLDFIESQLDNSLTLINAPQLFVEHYCNDEYHQDGSAETHEQCTIIRTEMKAINCIVDLIRKKIRIHTSNVLFAKRFLAPVPLKERSKRYITSTPSTDKNPRNLYEIKVESGAHYYASGSVVHQHPNDIPRNISSLPAFNQQESNHQQTQKTDAENITVPVVSVQKMKIYKQAYAPYTLVEVAKSIG